ncbi:MAG: hypothetical protein HY744_00210 [Deltaproteobacteria bacterium]|nr:hypothetical protein [Deltaproteobacteria bacterium]
MVRNRPRWAEHADEACALACLAVAVTKWRTKLPRNVEAEVACLPAGWCVVEGWPLEEDAGLPPVARGVRAAVFDATPYLDALADWAGGQWARQLCEVPARHVVFGVDFRNYCERGHGWELQALFVFCREAGRVVHATTKFASPGNWRRWLFASHDMSRHIVELPAPLGTTLLLDCHDLAALVQRRATPIGELRQRRDALRGLVNRSSPKSVVHVAHTMGKPITWARPIRGLARMAPSIEHHATAGRWERTLLNRRTGAWARNPHDLASYAALVHGMADILVLVPVE